MGSVKDGSARMEHFFSLCTLRDVANIGNVTIPIHRSEKALSRFLLYFC